MIKRSMHVAKWKIMIQVITIGLFISFISSQNIDNEGYNHWELQLMQFFSGNAYHFKSDESGLQRSIVFEIASNITVEEKMILISLENNSISKFFTMSFDHVLPNFHVEILEYYIDRQDTSIPNLIGCGTGMFLRSIEKGELMRDSTWNPYHDYLNELKFRESPTEIADSVSIRLGIYARSLPWSFYRSGMLYSNELKYDKETLIKDVEFFDCNFD